MKCNSMIKMNGPSLLSNKIPGNELANHKTKVLIRLQELDAAKRGNLYQNTMEYRSRASSGAMDYINTIACFKRCK